MVEKVLNLFKRGIQKSLDLSQAKLLLVYLPFLVVLIFTGLQKKAPVEDLTRDIFVVAQVPSYIGLVSNIGVLVWCAATVVCGLGFLILKGRNEAQACQFLVYSGCFSGLLMLDDLFLFHEQYYPIYFNIPEKAAYAGYAIMLCAILTYFRKFIYRTRFGFLIAALIFFGLSLLIDVLEGLLFDTSVEMLPSLLILLEDGSKLFGIVSWCAYLVMVCVERSRHANWKSYSNSQ